MKKISQMSQICNVKNGWTFIPISLVDEALNVALISSFEDDLKDIEVVADRTLWLQAKLFRKI